MSKDLNILLEISTAIAVWMIIKGVVNVLDRRNNNSNDSLLDLFKTNPDITKTKKRGRPKKIQTK